MNNVQCTYYRSDVTGVNYLVIDNSSYSHSELLENNTIRVIECDMKGKWMKVKERKKNCIEWEEMDLNQIQHGVIIDLSDVGDRWEGGCVNGLPFGYGCMYNSKNIVLYRGFVFDGMKVCYGSVFYDDCGIAEYVGGFYQNNRFGYGKLYSKKSELLYEGEWNDNNPITDKCACIEKQFLQNQMHFGLEEVTIVKKL